MKLIILVIALIFIGCSNSDLAIVDNSNQPSIITQESVTQSNPEIKKGTPIVTNSTEIKATKSQPEVTIAQGKSNNSENNKLYTINK